MRFKGIVAAVFSVVVLMTLAGCTLVPGSHMSVGSNSHWFGGASSADGQQPAAPLPDLVHVYPITTAILAGKGAPTKLPAMLPPLLQAPTAPYDYVVGVGDVLQVTVWDHPELTIPAGSKRPASESGNVVHSDGTIFYPYVGKLAVAGLDVATIRQLITTKLAKYIENPQVDVTVAAYKSQQVYVTGAVKKPSVIPVSNIPLHLVDAINAADGLTEDANWRDVVLTRDGKSYDLSLKAIYQQGKLQQNLLLEDGDVINVGRNTDNKVFMLGAVVKPQVLPMGRNGMTLAEAITTAGGIDQAKSNASGVFVMRKGSEDGKPSIDVYQLNEKNAAALVLADQFHLRSHDIVYVTAAPVALWNRVISQLMPTVQSIYYGALAADRVRSLDE